MEISVFKSKEYPKSFSVFVKFGNNYRYMLCGLKKVEYQSPDAKSYETSLQGFRNSDSVLPSSPAEMVQNCSNMAKIQTIAFWEKIVNVKNYWLSVKPYIKNSRTLWYYQVSEMLVSEIKYLLDSRTFGSIHETKEAASEAGILCCFDYIFDSEQTTNVENMQINSPDNGSKD